MAGGLLRPRLGLIQTDMQSKGMDEMDPQMSSVLAARVALEQLDTVGHGHRRVARRRSSALAHLSRSVAGRVMRLVVLRRSPRAVPGPIPARVASDR